MKFLRTIEWVPELNAVKMIDQRRLPGELTYLYCKTVEEMVGAIRSMSIRGAPALGVAGAFGVALAAQGCNPAEMRNRVREAGRMLMNARPTAVNLGWGVKRLLETVDNENIAVQILPDRLLAEALAMAEEDVHVNLLLAEYGASLIEDGDTIIHHCNTGALAVVDWGTALGAIRYAHEHGKRVHVLVDETRPRLQGARLTAWECEQYGIPYEIITDNAAGYFLQSGKVQKVFFGADRVAANGDVVNKIGTYMLSLAANANQVPVVCVFPSSTLDMSTESGRLIPIEERDEAEVLGIQFQGEAIAPPNARALNPAFDLTPHELISAWVTEFGVIRTPFKENTPGSVYNKTLDG